jgi:hypothetical protein
LLLFGKTGEYLNDRGSRVVDALSTGSARGKEQSIVSVGKYCLPFTVCARLKFARGELAAKVFNAPHKLGNVNLAVDVNGCLAHLARSCCRFHD